MPIRILFPEAEEGIEKWLPILAKITNARSSLEGVSSNNSERSEKESLKNSGKTDDSVSISLSSAFSTLVGVDENRETLGQVDNHSWSLFVVV